MEALALHLRSAANRVDSFLPCAQKQFDIRGHKDSSGSGRSFKKSSIIENRIIHRIKSQDPQFPRGRAQHPIHYKARLENLGRTVDRLTGTDQDTFTEGRRGYFVILLRSAFFPSCTLRTEIDRLTRASHPTIGCKSRSNLREIGAVSPLPP